MKTVVNELKAIVATFADAERQYADGNTSGCDICLARCADNCGGQGDWN